MSDPKEGAAATNVVVIDKDDLKNYPGYAITVEGEFVPPSHADPKKPIVILGPHTIVLKPIPPGVTVRFDLKHLTSHGGIPELIITIEKDTAAV